MANGGTGAESAVVEAEAMDDRHEQAIRSAYLSTPRDYQRLFGAVLVAASEVGWERALSSLEACTIERRVAWLEARLHRVRRTEDPIDDAYRLLYEEYLGISAENPKHGEVVVRTEDRLVLRWWNPCPVLDACVQLHLDTRRICRLAYAGGVQAMFDRIDPRLRFDRCYERIRPHAPYCEEIVHLIGEPSDENEANGCGGTGARCIRPS
jgi:hypothetical protein